MLITFASRSSVHLGAKSATSSPSRYAAAIIAKFTGLVTNPDGGNKPASMLSRPLISFGEKRTPFRRQWMRPVPGLPKNWVNKTRGQTSTRSSARSGRSRLTQEDAVPRYDVSAGLRRFDYLPTARALRQAWELDDADKAERLLRNLARRLDREAPGVAASILEGLDEILTVNRLGVPAKLRRSLACTNSIENMMGTVRRVCRNVKRWRNAAMALRWTAAGMMEAAKGFRRLKAYKQLPILRTALVAHAPKQLVTNKIEPQADAA
jgi:mutator family transposase